MIQFLNLHLIGHQWDGKDSDLHKFSFFKTPPSAEEGKIQKWVRSFADHREHSPEAAPQASPYVLSSICSFFSLA